MKKVIIGLTEEVMNNATVAGYEQQSKNVMEFLNNKGIKINKKLETKEYFINSFLPESMGQICRRINKSCFRRYKNTNSGRYCCNG